ncbi:MAG TPA: GFA family protein [Caulobacterales bacterium]|nr:GFA family protein [Caulobacterales bacterium]
MTTYSGSCHCGAISFTYEGELDRVISCNCSHCRRKGFLLAFGSEETIQVEVQGDVLGTYHFNKNTIDHHFCTRCGTATHAFGDVRGKRMGMVNVRCMPDVDLDALTLTKVDGASF